MTVPEISMQLPSVSREATHKGDTMREVDSLIYTRWECKYHVVFIPKYRKKAIFGQIR